jgi:transposase
MNYFTGCDAHKKYSVFTGIDDECRIQFTRRVEHQKETFREFLETLDPGTKIAVESTGNWYWLIDEMEKAGHCPVLTHAGKAKLMMGNINKTDKLDARGLALLLRNGTLPRIWIPPSETRDKRELPRMRLVLVHMRTMLKNRIYATFAKYGINFEDTSDLFGKRGRLLINKCLEELPRETRYSVIQELDLLDHAQSQIDIAEKRIKEVIKVTPAMQLLMTIPGVGPILAISIALEIGDVTRFPDSAHFASYAGTVSRISSSGGKTRLGRVRPDVNRYLKYAFIEAAQTIVLNQNRWARRHAVMLYLRIKGRRGHGKAVVAVARHFAEAAYSMLDKNEPYKDRGGKRVPRMRYQKLVL